MEEQREQDVSTNRHDHQVCARCGHTTPVCAGCDRRWPFLGGRVDGEDYCHAFVRDSEPGVAGRIGRTCYEWVAGRS